MPIQNVHVHKHQEVLLEVQQFLQDGYVLLETTVVLLFMESTTWSKKNKKI